MNTTQNRPYIFCHMMTSLDGKIMGNYMETEQSDEAGKVFYNIAFGKPAYYKHQGWLSGRITTDDNFTFYKKPVLNQNAPLVPSGNFVAQQAPMYYVSVDPSGKLGWQSNTLMYQDTKAHIIELITEQTSNAYKAFLREKNISYIIAGKTTLNYELALAQLKHLFGIKTLMLGGGGVLNWSFIQAGLCDEVSLVIAAAADACSTTPALFTQKEGLTTDTPVTFSLEHLEKMKKNTIWLRYKVNNKEQ